MSNICGSNDCFNGAEYEVRIYGNFRLDGFSITEDISARHYCAGHVVEATTETPRFGRVEVYRLKEGPAKEITPNESRYDSARKMIFSSRGITLGGNLPKLEEILSLDVVDILKKSVSAK